VALMERALPQMVIHAVTAQQAQEKGEGEFYGAYPDLKPHNEQVIALGRALRGQHPTMPEKEFAPMLARMSRAMLQTQTQPPAAAVPQPAQRPANGGHAPIVSPVPHSVRGTMPVDLESWEAQDRLFDIDLTGT
jgi:hypothetical protein